MLVWLQHHKAGETLSFMNEMNKELEGIVDTVHIEIDKFQKRICYSVQYQDTIINVDGETFRQI